MKYNHLNQLQLPRKNFLIFLKILKRGDIFYFFLMHASLDFLKSLMRNKFLFSNALNITTTKEKLTTSSRSDAKCTIKVTVVRNSYSSHIIYNHFVILTALNGSFFKTYILLLHSKANVVAEKVVFIDGHSKIDKNG